MTCLARKLAQDRRGNAAVELALILPLTLVILFGSAELGHYFMAEHALVKSVRDGARYAARQSIPNFAGCTSSPTDAPAAVTDATKLVVSKGSLDATKDDLLPNWSGVAASCAGNPSGGCFEVTMTCSTGAIGGETMSGIYNGMTSGAPVVTVTASLPYQTILGAMGFSGVDMKLNADSQAAVTGI